MIDQKNRTPEQRGTPPPIASGRMAGDRPAPFIHSVYRSAITSGALTDFQLRLFMLLCIYAGRDGVCNPSTATLARELKRSRSGVIAAITAIEAAGFICKIGGNVGAGRGNTNQYRIVLEASGDATAIPENVHPGRYFDDTENVHRHSNKMSTAIPENVHPGRHEQNIEKKQRTEHLSVHDCTDIAHGAHVHERDFSDLFSKLTPEEQRAFDVYVLMWEAVKQKPMTVKQKIVRLRDHVLKIPSDRRLIAIENAARQQWEFPQDPGKKPDMKAVHRHWDIEEPNFLKIGEVMDGKRTEAYNRLFRCLNGDVIERVEQVSELQFAHIQALIGGIPLEYVERAAARAETSAKQAQTIPEQVTRIIESLTASRELFATSTH